jgi:hypothetical protein
MVVMTLNLAADKVVRNDPVGQTPAIIRLEVPGRPRHDRHRGLKTPAVMTPRPCY